MLLAQQSKYGKNLQVLHFDPAPSQGRVMSGKCEEPKDKLTVTVSSPKLEISHFVSRTELRTAGQTDDLITRCPRPPCGPFRPAVKELTN